MTAPRLSITVRVRMPSLSEITDYLESHGWVLVPPDPRGPDRWAWGDETEASMEVPCDGDGLADWPIRAAEVLHNIACIEGRELVDIARDLDLFEVLP